ncbi:uncharacterized protein FTJAE_11366 [Fusarium tjaetaba]|uniref:Uncharacterized protein n=1 Tax=Fusarium tjaetaba TaxID=1567544 RepID=A0A8H5QVI0_9HYPO|nr:uncharacterized protein FTJAE_11366 [Fusarium tjaetaba]KAF5621337.1 hypothetical protein FTJAE_11366 [Fusarium tjaetaba]
MKFFTLLGFVSLTLALATKPIERDVKEEMKHPSFGDVKYTKIDGTDVGSIKVTRSDVQERGVVSLEKRLDGIHVPYGVADPQPMLMAGVTISFIMVAQWVRQGGHNVYTYVCNGLKFSNPTSRNKVVSVVANGVAVLRNQPVPARLAAQIGAPEEGYGSEISIIVGNSQ